MQSKFPIFKGLTDLHGCNSMRVTKEDILVDKLIRTVNRTPVSLLAAKRVKHLQDELSTFIDKYEKLKDLVSKSEITSQKRLSLGPRIKTSLEGVLKSVGVFVNYLKQGIEACEFSCETPYYEAFMEYTSTCRESQFLRPSLDAYFIMLDTHEAAK